MAVDADEDAPRIDGHCDERFAAVRAASEDNFRERGELGAGVTVRVGGETVVDLWGGWADPARTRPWERDTLVNVWSTTKGPTALCAHLLADRGGSSTWTRRWRRTGPSSPRRARRRCLCAISSPIGPGSPAFANRTRSTSCATGS